MDEHEQEQEQEQKREQIDVPTGELVDHGPGPRQPDRGDLEAARAAEHPGPKMGTEISGAGAGMTGSVGPATDMSRGHGRGGENLDPDEDPRQPRD
jgi:hypothetical protein